jgi:hypothetical protein
MGKDKRATVQSPEELMTGIETGIETAELLARQSLDQEAELPAEFKPTLAMIHRLARQACGLPPGAAIVSEISDALARTKQEALEEYRARGGLSAEFLAPLNLRLFDLATKVSEALSGRLQAIAPQALSWDFYDRLTRIAGNVTEAHQGARHDLEALLHTIVGRKFATLRENQMFTTLVAQLLDTIQHGVTCPKEGCDGIGKPKWEGASSPETGVLIVEHSTGGRANRHGGGSTFPELNVVPLARKKPGPKKAVPPGDAEESQV